MERSARRAWIGAAAVIVVSAVAAAVFFVESSRSYDPAFDTRIAKPTYSAGRPIVLYDEGHRNTHAADGAYKPFVDLLRNDGYDVRITRRSLSADALRGASVLVVALARGTNDANDGAAFTESETAAVAEWVRSGGSLLLVTDHWPYGPAVASLARRFDVETGNGLVEDPQHHDPSRGESHLVFSQDNDLLRDHPIVSGRNPAEAVHRVLTFTGESMRGPSSSVAFLALSDAAVELPPTRPKVEKAGGDVRVTMEYGAPESAKGRAQGIALEVEHGRIVILGDAGMLRAQVDRNGERVGMNVAGYNNRQLAINIAHWLSRAI